MDELAGSRLNEALEADSIGLKEVAIKTYMEASEALLMNPLNSLDLMIFEDDFEARNDLVEESKKNLQLLEKCLQRTKELFSALQDDDNNESEHLQLERSRSSSTISNSSSHTASPPRKNKKKSSFGGDLSQVRKQFEKASLAEIIARQKKQSNTLQLPVASSKAAKGFTVNLQMISDLLMNRQDAIGQLNEKLTQLFENIRGGGSEERADEEIWRKTLKLALLSGNYSLQPIGPIIGLLSHPSHPISEIARDFVHRLKDLCGSIKLSNNQSSLCPTQISKEYHQFSFQMIKLLQHNYAEELKSEPVDALVLPLHISIETFIFSHIPALNTMISDSFFETNRQEDAELLEQFTRLSWMDFEHEDALYAILNVPTKYRLSPKKYESAIDELRHAVSLKCPSSKANSAVKACELICSAIHECNSSESDLSVGSEDLVFLLSWVIVQAQIPNLATFFALVSEFIPEDLIRGQAGGKGLGKDEDGQVRPVQVEQKQNVKGIGFGTEGLFAPWWDDLYTKSVVGSKIKCSKSKTKSSRNKSKDKTIKNDNETQSDNRKSKSKPEKVIKKTNSSSKKSKSK